MNGKLSKKLRKIMKRNWAEFYKEVFALPFKVRLRIAWSLVTYRKPKSKTDKVWNERRKAGR